MPAKEVDPRAPARYLQMNHQALTSKGLPRISAGFTDGLALQMTDDAWTAVEIVASLVR